MKKLTKILETVWIFGVAISALCMPIMTYLKGVNYIINFTWCVLLFSIGMLFTCIGADNLKK